MQLLIEGNKESQKEIKDIFKTTKKKRRNKHCKPKFY